MEGGLGLCKTHVNKMFFFVGSGGICEGRKQVEGAYMREGEYYESFVFSE